MDCAPGAPTALKNRFSIGCFVGYEIQRVEILHRISFY